MNHKITKKLRKMALQGAINCTPKRLTDPAERARFELNTGMQTYEKLKKIWKRFSIKEKTGISQSFVDRVARETAFPTKRKEGAESVTKTTRLATKHPRTKHRSKLKKPESEVTA